MKLRFYEHFACAYGTLWLLILGLALVTHSYFNTGRFGMVGFPIISLIYAFMRRSQDRRDDDLIQSLQKEIEHLRGERAGMFRAVQENESSRRS
jgi:membrane protein implicated in regulation of membrane protease activity